MKRPSSQIRHKRQAAIFNFFILIILLLVSRSDLFSQELTKFQLEEGKQETWTLKLNDLCPYKPHFYRIKNQPGFITFAEQTNSILVGVGTVGTITAAINTTGLATGVHSGRVTVECLDCEKRRLTTSKIYYFELTVSNPIPKPDVTSLTSTPTTKPTSTSTEKPKPVEASTPPPTPTQMPDSTEAPTEPPESPTTPTQAKVPIETPVKTPLLPSSPAKLFLAQAIPRRDAVPTPAAEASPRPTSEIPAIPENPAAAEVANAGNLSYLALVLVLIFALLIGSLVGKKLFEKWKYGTNAINLRALKEAMALKEDLAGKWLKKRKSQNIHAIGVGKISGTENYCIQLFVENANGQMPDNPPIDLLPERFRKYPIVIYEMPRAEFITENSRSRAREAHDTIIGGISGANANLSNEYGTIGYFCVPTILHPIRKFHREVYLLSNSHVFANLSNVEKTAKDLIQQPSPGEYKKSKFIASLENFVPIKFDNDTDDPNFADAAIAKIFRGKRHKLEIPVIGKINDFVSRDRVEIRQNCRKFGRTTGYTEGQIFSIHLSIWIRYASTGQESFFKEQFLIVPADTHENFIQGGDSGSLLVDYDTKALGLICAGANSNTNFGLENLPDVDPESLVASITTEKIRSYGIANPISEVMKSLHVKLML